MAPDGEYARRPLRLSAGSGDRVDKRCVLPRRDRAKIEDQFVTLDAPVNGEAGRSQPLVESIDMTADR